MPLLMALSCTESLDHLEHVMGPCWCFWAGPHQYDHEVRIIQSAIQIRNVLSIYLEQASKNRKSHNCSFKSHINFNITSPHVFKTLGLLKTTKNS